MRAKTRLIGLLLVALVAIAAAGTALAATTVEKIPITGTETLCGSGDIVSLSGTLLAVTSTTATPSGGFVETIHFQPQGLSGIDTTTGTIYRAVGVTREVTVTIPAGVEFTDTFVNRFHLQATAGAESLIFTETFHVTVTADGIVRVEFSKASSTC